MLPVPSEDLGIRPSGIINTQVQSTAILPAALSAWSVVNLFLHENKSQK